MSLGLPNDLLCTGPCGGLRRRRAGQLGEELRRLPKAARRWAMMFDHARHASRAHGRKALRRKHVARAALWCAAASRATGRSFQSSEVQ